MRIQVDTVLSVHTHAWDTYVLQQAQATHYHLSGWGRIIERVYGYPSLYFTAWDGEALRGILPVVILGGLFRRKSLVSMPYLDYGGICADTPEITQALYRAVAVYHHGETGRFTGSASSWRHGAAASAIRGQSYHGTAAGKRARAHVESVWGQTAQPDPQG